MLTTVLMREDMNCTGTAVSIVHCSTGLVNTRKETLAIAHLGLSCAFFHKVLLL